MRKDNKFRVIEYPFHIGDLVGGTTNLDDAQFGAYMRLLIANIQAGTEGLDADQDVLRSYTRMTEKGWVKLWKLIGGKFVENGGKISHPRVAATILTIINKSDTARANRLKGLDTGTTDVQLPLDDSTTPRGTNLKTSKPTHNNKPLDSIPANNPEGEVSISSKPKVFGGPYRIMDVLSEKGRQAARAAAPGWDISNLGRIYDQKIADGSFQEPRSPDHAFPAWAGIYTKGKPPS